MLDVDKIYICHYNKLVDRKKILVDNLHRCGLDNYTWVESFDKDDLDILKLSIEFPYLFNPNPKGRYLKFSEISLLLKHSYIIEESNKNNFDTVLVLEDDVVLNLDFSAKFNNFKSQLPKDWDICFIGDCCNLHIEPKDGKNVQRSNSSRCTHAYILSKCGINKMIKHIRYANDAIDWYYNTMIEKLSLNCYWFEPSLASQNKKFNSTIQL